MQDQHLHLPGVVRSDLAEFVWRRAPEAIRTIAVDHVDELFEVTMGSPLSVRFVLGLLLDFGWDELLAVLSNWAENTRAGVPVQGLCVLAVENYALQNPTAAALLGRMSHAVGGVTYTAMRQLFWEGLGNDSAFETTLATLGERGLLELDPFNQRAFIHPIVRRYLTENAPMLGEEWDRRHAVFFLGAVQQYQHLPLERWSEVDMDWGNIYVGADWCARRAERIWERSAMEMIADPTLDQTAVAAETESPENYADLCLARDYALALADYAFWRHPPGIVRWLAVGAVAAFATQDMRNYGWFLMNIGRQMFFLGRLPEAIQWVDRARPIFDERDLLAELAYVHTDLGTTYRVLDEPRRALEHFLVAFDCTAQLGDTRGLATAYMNLGSAQFSLGQHDRALAEQRKALRVALRLNDRHLIASAYNNMGLSLEAMERFDDATHVYEHALRTFEQNDDQIGVSACFNNLGSVSYAQGKFGKALTWYERDRALLQTRGAWTDMAATLHNLGHVAMEQHELQQALSFFTQSRDLYAAFDLNDYVAEEVEMIHYVQEQKPVRG
ncbi:MAG: tetratricopeptide repeat protein [Anaerolineales bacterium]|nr:tetratricopeptide repeat protein [Anaerolineales bacterium]